MAKVRLTTQRRDQKPFTRYNPDACTIHQALKREYGVRVSVGEAVAYEKGGRGRVWRLRRDAQDAVGAHDSGVRVGTRTVTLDGPRLRSRADREKQVQAARDARRQARDTVKADAAERSEAARKAREQAAAERPDPRQQARQRPRAEGRDRAGRDERAEREQARVRAQEAEGREWLNRARTRQQAPALRERQPEARRRERSAPQARVQQPRVAPRQQPRAIDPPRLRWSWNPFARQEPVQRRDQPQPVKVRR